MLTQHDIKNLIAAMRLEFATKLDLAELRDDFRVLQTAVDASMKRFDAFQTELLATNHRVTRLEKHTGLI